MGARTLAGALVPLRGAAPTNFNFVAGDYNRTLGLKGNGTSKQLDANRNNNAEPQNNQHLSVFAAEAPTSVSSFPCYIGNASGGGDSHFGVATSSAVSFFRSRAFQSASLFGTGAETGFIGISRNSPNIAQVRFSGSLINNSLASETPSNGSITVFRAGGTNTLSNARIAYYSIGEAVDLAALDARVTTLRNAIAAALA
jgi:hypothetical protein